MTKYILTVFEIILFSIPCFSQNDQPFSLSGKVTHEYRSNFIRLPDSLTISDSRTNLFLNADRGQKFWNNGRLGMLYELRYHRYGDYHNYNRHDHFIRVNFQKPIFRNVKLQFADEFRSRFSSTRHYSYYRNIIDLYLNFPITTKDRAYVGFQKWLKNYPKTSDYKKYSSSRLYSKFNVQLSRTTILGLKLEFHQHEGNLYPGSTASDFNLDLDGNRYVFQAMLDKMVSRKIFTSFAYRFENDMAGDIDDEQSSDYYGDENEDELLAEDSDLGYLKNQFSLSTLFKLNLRVSMMTFYLTYNKSFKYWYITPEGPKRHDRIIFLSHIVKIRFYKSLNLEVQHIYENNVTNLKYQEYHLNSYSAGLSIQY